MTNVHTLRIILGHPNLTDALLRCFFDSTRSIAGSGCNPVRRLWLENCRISAGLNISLQSHPYLLPLTLDFSGLQAVRFRRLPMRPGTPIDLRKAGIVYSRGGLGGRELQDGTGGQYTTSISNFNDEWQAGTDHVVWLQNRKSFSPLKQVAEANPGSSPLEKLYEYACRWDDIIYRQLARDAKFPLPSDLQELGSLSLHDRAIMAYRGQSLDAGGLYTHASE